ncbi:TPA: hypothetical protein DIC20_05080 [Candidatus Dependentiae bacterium]|nr:hypothetical protein [Candidatus Dependentiae bacterium]HCU01044.1 hypothetical protein [Candidatus Dependentiae bacterium]
MKHFSQEKYQIAWFKLSEFIKRRQKERAIGMYKLLMHSVEDPAFAKQVEGDLLLFFEEPKALDSYLEAATMYKKNGNLAQATAIYEHLVILEPQNADFINQLGKLYSSLNHQTRITLSLQRLIKPIIHAGNIAVLLETFEQFMSLLDVDNQAKLYKTTVLAMLTYDRENAQIILPLIKQTINCLALSPQELTQFISHIGTIDKDYYREAQQLRRKLKNEAEN